MGIWLRLFQIFTILGIIVLPVTIIYLAYTIRGIEIDKGTWVYFIAVLIESLPVFTMSILIFFELRKIKPSTPEEIQRLLLIQFSLSIVISLILYILYKQSYTTMQPSGILGDILYCIIWVSFFRRSKRVKSYYESKKT